MNRRSFIRAGVSGVATLSLVAALGLAGCGSNGNDNAASDAGDASGEPAVTLQVFAANSLEKALPEVQALYTAAHSNVTFADTQFKSSGDLVAQLEGGASADVLITASSSTMDTAEEEGFIDADTRSTMFVNDLVVVSADGSDITIQSLEDLADDSITSIAIGEPNAVPAGKYAVQALEAAGLLTTETDEDGIITITGGTVFDKLNYGADKVGTVASYVNEGQCDVGLVYTSDLYRYDGIANIYTVPADMHSDIVYPGAVISDSAAAETAADFLDFCLTNEEALGVFQKYGFELA